MPKQDPKLREAKAEAAAARRLCVAARKEVTRTQKNCIDNFPNPKDAGAAYRSAVSEHVKAIKYLTATQDKVTRLM